MLQFNSNMYALYKWVKPEILDLLLTLAKSLQRRRDRKKLNTNAFNCRVQLTKQKRDDSIFDAFTIQIVGSIWAASDNDLASVQILISDVTEGIDKAKPVLQRISNCSEPVFCYRADLGRILNRVTTLSDWTTVAHLNIDWLLLPHKGKRLLQFSISVLSNQMEEPLPQVAGLISSRPWAGGFGAHAECLFAYENPAFGYIDLQGNAHRTKNLAVALAFAVSAADNKLYHAEVRLIKDWAKKEFRNSKLEEALDQAVSFFQKGNQLNIYKVCREIVEIAPLSDRYDILELCLRVARAKGTVAVEELTVLKNIAAWLEVDMDRFHSMMEKILPVNIHQVKDAKLVLGIAPDESSEKARRQLNKQYRKWNSRVTSTDPEIQTQADQMLKLIAETRSQYVG